MFVGWWMPDIERWDYFRCKAEMTAWDDDLGAYPDLVWEMTDHVSRTKPYYGDTGVNLDNIPLDEQENDWFERDSEQKFFYGADNTDDTPH